MTSPTSSIDEILNFETGILADVKLFLDKKFGCDKAKAQAEEKRPLQHEGAKPSAPAPKKDTKKSKDLSSLPMDIVIAL
eukprot:CAMPEP_0201516508 /NCGR_PEP_ID=MMETSP0161_2-20130828/7823_1 /ASSEMBLY_ACC=CAM_ASM_000251 /TAXON_ID=180227 /ORGANISM="Neoparamoeba aestuarina, Strain SoJaBio B1-5/56/2" /LENGTH=78 /DNA_ID=CAMNT_0047913667 /DNA_START=26 /DNA_END=262 /DNA_ORIENTATION=-